MKTILVALSVLLAGAGLVAFADAAEAKQACTSLTDKNCNNYLVCVYDRVHGEWVCAIQYYPGPCDFSCPDPWLP